MCLFSKARHHALHFRPTAFGTAAQHKNIIEQDEEIFSKNRRIICVEDTNFSTLIKVTIFITSSKDINELRKVLYKLRRTHAC